MSESGGTDWLKALAPIAIAVVAVAIAVVGALFRRWSQGGAPDANRDLSADEVAFIDASAERVRAYAEAQGYGRYVWLIQGFGLVSVFAGIAVGGVVAFTALAMIDAPTDGPSFPIVLKSGGLSAVAWIFVGIFMSALPNSVLSRLSPRYAERAGWVAIGIKNEYASLNGMLTAFVRGRRLSTLKPINPGDFLRAANFSLEKFYYVAAAVVAAFALFFMHRDLTAVDVLTADGIELTNYWTLARERFGYDDVAQVEVRCFFSKNDPVEAYELQLKSGQTRNIYKQSIVAAKLAAFETIDAKLISLGVPFAPGPHQGWFRGSERGYDPDCVESVAKRFPEDVRPRVRRLFHLDELEAVETIWPWDTELAAAKTAASRYDVKKAVALYTKAIASGRLAGQLLAVAYRGRAEARNDYEAAYGIRDSEMLLALRDYEKAREIAPTVGAYRDEARALIALGAYEEASAAYRKALELDKPRPHWSLIGLARVERIRGRTDEAMRHLDEVLGVWGEGNASMPIYYHRARVLYLKNDNAGVVDAINRGLAYQTDYASAYHWRACAYARLGDFAKAKDDIVQTVKLSRATPNDPWERTPNAAAYHAEIERDRGLIDALSDGSAGDDARATLCRDTWNYGEELRARSPLLPPAG